MDVSTYRKNVFLTLSTTNAKNGLRVMSQNLHMTNLGHALVGLKTESGEVIQAAQNFVLGMQINDDIRANVREELGDLLYYLTVAAKELKVKLPSSTKKVKPKHTMTELILQVDSLTTDLLSLYKKVYYGQGLGEKAIVVDKTEEEVKSAQTRLDLLAAKTGEVPAVAKTTKKVDSESKVKWLGKVTDKVSQLIPVVYELCWAILAQPVSEVMEANMQKLIFGPNARYPEHKFSVESIEKKDLADEQKSVA